MPLPNNGIDRSISLSRQISAQTVPTTSSETTSSNIEGDDGSAKSFNPKKPVQLQSPKDDPITVSELSKCDGTDPSKPILVAIKGTVFDVSGNKAYAPEGNYHVFAGKDPSRALAKSSLKPEDAIPEWQDLEGKEKTVLSEWFTFFSKRYNIVGKVVEDDSGEADSD